MTRRSLNNTETLGTTPYAAVEAAAALINPGKGHELLEPKKSQYLIKGCNLGIGVNTIDTFVGWGTNYDFAGWTQPNLDRIANAGFNSVRIQGCYSAYAADPTAYTARYRATMDYAISLGLRVIYCFFNNRDDNTHGPIASTSRTAYAAMATALATPYAGNKMLIGWDLCNEADHTISDLVTTLTNFKTDLRVIDATTPITVSIAGVNTGLNYSLVTSWDSLVDFHDVHWYVDPGTSPAWSWNALDDLRFLTTKPILIGEFGANISSSAGGPHVNDESQVAAYIRAVVHKIAASDLMGYMVWQVQSDTTASDFGLYTTAGAVRETLNEMIRQPRDRTTWAKTLIDHRLVPVAIDNFGRAASASSLGTAPMGGAWTAGLGTWGINSSPAHLAYCATGDAGGHNVAVLETNTSDVFIELEVLLGATTANVGIIYRYTDSTHYGLLQLTSAANGTIKLFENNAGFTTLTNRTSQFAANNTAKWARLAVDLRYDTVTIYLNGKIIDQQRSRTFNVDATKHGMYRWTGGTPDATSSFRKFSASVHNRFI